MLGLSFLLFLQCVATYDVALVTFHGGDSKGEVNNIQKFEFAMHPDEFRYAGDLLSNEVAMGLHSLRGLVYNPVEDDLYFVNAYSFDSKLLYATGVSSGSVYGELINGTQLEHPYGIALSNSSIYISNQGNGQIVKFSRAYPQSNQALFAAVGDPRGVAVDRRGNVWVADKATDSLIRYAPSGRATLQVPVSWPIAVVIYDDLVFATSRDGPRSVLTFDVNTGRLTNRTYSSPAVTTPCGVVVHEPSNSLYVMTQKPNLIHRFLYQEKTYVGTVTDVLPDIPQHIIIVPFKDVIARVPVATAQKQKKKKVKKGSKKSKNGN